MKHVIELHMLLFIDGYYRAHHRAPTYREIGYGVKQPSTSVIRYHLHKLAEARLISLEEKTSRSALPTPQARNYLGGAFLALPYPVSLNAAYRGVGNRLVLTDEARDYKEAAHKTALVMYRDDNHSLRDPLKGDLAMKLWLYRPANRGDIDNFTKLLQDSLQQVVYANDSQIIEQHLYKRIDSAYPRVEVEVICL